MPHLRRKGFGLSQKDRTREPLDDSLPEGPPSSILPDHHGMHVGVCKRRQKKGSSQKRTPLPEGKVAPTKLWTNEARGLSLRVI